jgi:hypothetical protein
VNLRPDQDYVEKGKALTLPGLELRPLSRPARSQSISRLLVDMKIILKYILGTECKDMN